MKFGEIIILALALVCLCLSSYQVYQIYNKKGEENYEDTKKTITTNRNEQIVPLQRMTLTNFIFGFNNYTANRLYQSTVRINKTLNLVIYPSQNQLQFYGKAYTIFPNVQADPTDYRMTFIMDPSGRKASLQIEVPGFSSYIFKDVYIPFTSTKIYEIVLGSPMEVVWWYKPPPSQCQILANLVSSVIVNTVGTFYTSPEQNLSNNFSYRLGTVINRELANRYLLTVGLLNDMFNLSSSVNIKNARAIVTASPLFFSGADADNINYSVELQATLMIDEFLINNIVLLRDVRINDFRLTGVSIPMKLNLILSVNKKNILNSSVKQNGNVNFVFPDVIKQWLDIEANKLSYTPDVCQTCPDCSWYDLPCWVNKGVCETGRQSCLGMNITKAETHKITDRGIAEAILRQSDLIANNIKALLTSGVNEQIPVLLSTLNSLITTNSKVVKFYNQNKMLIAAIENCG